MAESEELDAGRLSPEEKEHTSGDQDLGERTFHGDDDEMSWNDLTLPMLTEELNIRGLDTNGTRAELIARLEKYDNDVMAQHKQDEAEGDEFVVWNADDDVDPEPGSNGKKEDEEDAAAEDEMKKREMTTGDDANAPKEPDPDFSITLSKDKDLLYLMWAGTKIPIPFRDEVQKDLRHVGKLQNVIMYPVVIGDLYSDFLRPFIASAINVSTELDETIPGQPIKGYLRLKFASVAEAANAIEIIKEYQREGLEPLTLKYFADDDSEGHVLSKIKKEDAEKRGGPLPTRLVYVGNLPPDASEDALKQTFPDAIRIFMPTKEDSPTAEKIGYAYLEYVNEADAIEAVKNYQEVEMDGHKLYIIRSMTDRVMSFGLLKDSLRTYWMEQIHALEESKAKAVGKTPRELEAMDEKLIRMKRRIKNDNTKREMLRLPIPESEIVDVPDEEEKKAEGVEGDGKKDDKGREKHSHSAHRDKKSAERRRTPPPRRRYSPQRFQRGGFRGVSRGGYRGGPPVFGGPRDVGADRLVDRLQELVGALTHRDRDYGSGYGGRGGGGSVYYDPQPRRAPMGGYGGSSGAYRDDYPPVGSSGRYGGKRPGDHMDYGSDRKRHADEMDYVRYSGGRGGGGGYSGGYGSGRRGGPSYY